VTQEPSAGPGGRVVVLLSGSGTLLQSLLDATRGGDAGFAVVAVVSDRADAYGLVRAREAGLPTAVVALGDFPDRATWNVAVERAVRTFRPDLVVLAGFMRILGEPVLSAYGGRIINTHPALLPAFKGWHAVRDALEAGVKVTGCTVHVVTEEMDEGPILAQEAVPVLEDDTEETLHERIKEVERRLLPDTIRRFVEAQTR
jgi:phosphoribosylglycinamide formyltransferase-1